jgi:hypothetical protein
MRTQTRRQVVNKVAAEETFKDMEEWTRPWVTSAVSKGMDEECAVNAVHDAFLYTYEHHDQSRGAFNTLMTTKLRCNVKDYNRQRTRRNQRTVSIADYEQEVLATEHRTWCDILDKLTGDAHLLATLATDPPAFLGIENGCITSIRAAIRGILLELGWSKKRIRVAITELVKALRD